MVGIKNFDTIAELQYPRRVMRYVLVYCASGKLTMAVDEKALTLAAGEVLTITSGQYHYVKNAIKATGYILEFTLDFFCKNDKDIELFFHNGLFCHFEENEIIPVDENIVETQLSHIQNELEHRPYQYLISVHSRIELILVAINRTKVNRGDEIWKPEALFLKFLDSVRSNFEHNYLLSKFAKMLGTTQIKLNELAKRHVGKTAQNVIYGLIASEAKRLFTYENLSVKEVAYKPGFNDPFHFSNFFKKQTKTSPKQYKVEHAF